MIIIFIENGRLKERAWKESVSPWNKAERKWTSEKRSVQWHRKYICNSWVKQKRQGFTDR
jgi:hypothetical protein